MPQNPSVNAPRRLAVVTGASSGIGACFAEVLAKQGHDLVVIARREDRLTALKQRLEEAAGVSIHVLVADLIVPDALNAVGAELESMQIDLLVNCAGFGTYAPFATVDPERLQRELLLNLVAPVTLTRAVVPGMVRRGRGDIINVSSMAGFLPIPFQPTYCAGKAGLTRFTQALQGELAGTGVRLQALCPGPVPTEFFGISGYPLDEVPDYLMQSAQDCVTASLAALDRGAVTPIPQRAVRTFVAVMRRLPLALRTRILREGPNWRRGRQ